MTTRMMLVSDLDRNQEAARARCEEYGIDFDTARAWAIQQAKEQMHGNKNHTDHPAG